jgi:peroxiredoxin
MEMRRLLSLILIVTPLVLSSAARGGEYNEVLSIGDSAPGWADLPGTDGKTHSLADYKAKEFVVLVFTCASCPTAADYEDRINDLAKRLGGDKGRVAVVAVCVNRVKGDLLPDLTVRAKERGFVFDYLYDESQKIARDYGAIFTPEFYVLNRERKVIYMGALDDQSDPAKVQKKYVEEAIAATVGGSPVAVAETIARGCRVRYARERR